jgi:uncharacterized membrane protein YphA (DoxX/SURF4 family)
MKRPAGFAVRKTLYASLRFGLGTVLLVSSIFKADSPLAASQLTSQFLAVPVAAANVIVYFLCLTEFTIALFFWFDRCVRFASVSSAALFMAAIAVGISTSGDPVDCGCFGDLMTSVTGTSFLVRSFVFLGTSMLTLYLAIELTRGKGDDVHDYA